MTLPVQDEKEYAGGLSGEKVSVKNGCISVTVKANSGEIWIPVSNSYTVAEPIKLAFVEKTADTPKQEKKPAETEKHVEVNHNKSFDEMTVEELQEAILERMRRNGPVTEQMKKDVLENVYHNSLVTWIKSFN